MELTNEKRDGIVIIRIQGDLDGGSAPQLETEIRELVTPECKCLVLGMKECEFVSSAGLRVLLLSAKLLKSYSNGVVALTGLSDEVLDVMEMTGFEPYFQYYDSVDEACQSI